MRFSKGRKHYNLPFFCATPKSVRSESNESGFGATPKKIGWRVESDLIPKVRDFPGTTLALPKNLPKESIQESRLANPKTRATTNNGTINNFVFWNAWKKVFLSFYRTKSHVKGFNSIPSFPWQSIQQKYVYQTIISPLNNLRMVPLKIWLNRETSNCSGFALIISLTSVFCFKTKQNCKIAHLTRTLVTCLSAASNALTRPATAAAMWEERNV
jgi:hypothetical protein